MNLYIQFFLNLVKKFKNMFIVIPKVILKQKWRGIEDFQS